MAHSILLKKGKETAEEAIRHFIDKVIPKRISTSKKGDFSNPPAVYIRNERIIRQILNES